MRGFAVDSSRQCRKMTHAQCEGLLSPKGLPSCSDRELCFVKKMDLTWESMGEVWGELSFRPKLPQKGRGHLKHDSRLTKRLLPNSTMTYRGRSDGLVQGSSTFFSPRTPWLRETLSR